MRASLQIAQVGIAAALFCATAQAAAASELPLHFGQVATRAIAYFRAADSVETRLRGQGVTLHPQLAGLRIRIEAALDATESALKQGDNARAEQTLLRAAALLDRYARSFGGN
jgi:hypothetical protein